jgi:hypothetical protein
MKILIAALILVVLMSVSAFGQTCDSGVVCLPWEQGYPNNCGNDRLGTCNSDCVNIPGTCTDFGGGVHKCVYTTKNENQECIKDPAHPCKVGYCDLGTCPAYSLHNKADNAACCPIDVQGIDPVCAEAVCDNAGNCGKVDFNKHWQSCSTDCKTCDYSGKCTSAYGYFCTPPGEQDGCKENEVCRDKGLLSPYVVCGVSYPRNECDCDKKVPEFNTGYLILGIFAVAALFYVLVWGRFRK